MSSKSNGHQTSAVGPGRKQHSQNSPTVHLTPGEVVSIDGDYLPQSRPRPPSMMMMSNGSSVSSTPDTTMNLAWQQQQSNNRPGGQRSGPTDGRDRPWSNAEQPQQPQPPQSPLSETSMRSDGRPSDSEAPTYTSQCVFVLFCFFKMNVRVFFNSCVCFVFRLIQGLRWIRTLPASLATSLAVRACRKNGTPRWTPRTRTPTKGIRNSGWLHSSFTLLPF